MKNTIKIIALLSWPLYLNKLYLIPLGSTQSVFFWTLDFVFFVGIPSITLMYLLRAKIISSQEIGITLPIRPISITLGLVLAPILIFIVDWNIWPFFESLMPGRLFYGYDFVEAEPWRTIQISYASVTAGVLEELVYRGVVISQLQKHFQSRFAVPGISSLIFGGIHWGSGLSIVLASTIWAIPLALWFSKSRSIWGPMACHTTTDLLTFFSLM